MHIIVIGGGDIGYPLAQALAPAHDVFVVDADPAVGERFADDDVEFVAGSGANPDVLRRAGVERCAAFIAATRLDEVNFVCCALASKLGVRRTICFASREDLLSGGARGLQQHFGIDEIIWPEAELAEHIERVVLAPGATDAGVFVGGRIELLEYRLGAESPLVGSPVASLELPAGVVLVAAEQDLSIVIPRGGTRLAAGDKVVLMGDREGMAQLRAWMAPGTGDAAQRVTIIGGGDVGYRLAQRLERAEGVELRVIERERERGELLAATLGRALAARGKSRGSGSTGAIELRTVNGMAMGKRPAARQASPMWVNATDLPRSDGHPFFERLNRILAESGFDAFVEGLCAAFYADRLGRPSLRPGRYFRLLFIGYFEGLSSERGIVWRVADSLSLRSFLELDMTEAAPDHSTLSRTRRRIDVETHEAVFTWVLERVSEAGLVRGKTVGIDATTLEANAAMRSIERRDTGESYAAFVRRLAEASGIETPTRAELARFDRSRKDKKTSNKEWRSPQDPDAKVAKMKDGRTHLAHKVEQGVDMETGAILSVTVQDASAGDTATLPGTLTMASEQVEAVQPEGAGVVEVVADKGYHSDATLVELAELGVRSYISEPERGPRRWQDKRTGETPPEKRAAQQALYGNRRRNRGNRGRRLQRRRGELVERPFAHQYVTGGLRRVWVRGHENVRKRVLLQAAVCNLGLLLRDLTGIGTPRSLQGRALSAICGLIGHLIDHWGRLTAVWGSQWRPAAFGGPIPHRQAA